MLGVIPGFDNNFRRGDPDQEQNHKVDSKPVHEGANTAYKTLRTNIQFSNNDDTGDHGHQQCRVMKAHRPIWLFQWRNPGKGIINRL